MQLYSVRRRGGWRSFEELQEAAARSTRVANREMPHEVRWIRSYVIDEDDGTVGTLGIYQATGPEALREHAHRADLPADEILAVTDTVVIRPDPVFITA